MKFDFSEEEITEMYKLYEGALNELQEETKKVVDKITEKARELSYKPVTNLSIEAISYYNNELKQAELSAMSEWQSSELSFSSIMDKMSAGDNAKNRGKELESQIEQEIQSWKRMDDSNLAGIDDTNWHGSYQDFQDISFSINNFIQSMESMSSKYTNMIQTKKADNQIYISIEPVVIQSVSIVSEGFKEGISQSFSELANEFQNKLNEVSSLGNSVGQSVAAKSQANINSGVESLKAKVKQILD